MRIKNCYNLILLSLFLFVGQTVLCQTDSSSQKYITVHFLYGSKPAKGFKDSEKKYFGGIHGGHVSMQIDSAVFSFTPKSGWHYIAKHKNIRGGYILESLSSWVSDTSGAKYTSILIPISDSQYVKLKNIETQFLAESPYDYAFLGMRCASAAADVLSKIGILKSRSTFGDIRKNFYPKRFRRKLVRYAKRENLRIIRKEGRASRKWEKD